MKQAYGYSRVSGLNQKKGDGFQRQSQAIKQYCKSHRIDLTQIFEEQISGTKDQESRPIFTELINQILANSIRTIVIDSMDRLTRDLFVQKMMLTFFADNNITLHVASTGRVITPDTTNNPDSELLLNLEGAIAMHARQLIVKRLKAGRDRASKKIGRRVEGKPNFYRDTEAGRLVVKRIKELRRKPKQRRRKTYTVIAETLNAEGIQSKDGKPWYPAKVRSAITK